ncbi:MAG: hypothetical protein IT384_00500 [Deltaproteobacteria bacterium]|nr:hypothetical protein [Deltaproteobacteria bacterium]
MGPRKTEQLQIRLTAAEKGEIRRAAKAAKMDLSRWVLSKLLVEQRSTFRALVRQLPEPGESAAAFAELSDFLHELPRSDFGGAVDVPPPPGMSNQARNYVAAMVEHAAAKKEVRPPSWTARVDPLARPYFATTLRSLRIYLMTHAPIAFRRRNIFVDASVGDRV